MTLNHKASVAIFMLCASYVLQGCAVDADPWPHDSISMEPVFDYCDMGTFTLYHANITHDYSLDPKYSTHESEITEMEGIVVDENTARDEICRTHEWGGLTDDLKQLVQQRRYVTNTCQFKESGLIEATRYDEATLYMKKELRNLQEIRSILTYGTEYAKAKADATEAIKKREEAEENTVSTALVAVKAVGLTGRLAEAAISTVATRAFVAEVAKEELKDHLVDDIQEKAITAMVAKIDPARQWETDVESAFNNPLLPENFLKSLADADCT